MKTVTKGDRYIAASTVTQASSASRWDHTARVDPANLACGPLDPDQCLDDPGGLRDDKRYPSGHPANASDGRIFGGRLNRRARGFRHKMLRAGIEDRQVWLAQGV
jgi:hypothetical protein